MSLLRLYYCEADEERKADIDHHKNDQLKKQEEGKNHWKKELSSNSESAVSEAFNEWEELGECIVWWRLTLVSHIDQSRSRRSRQSGQRYGSDAERDE